MTYRITYYLRGPFKDQIRWQIERRYDYRILFRNLFRWEMIAFDFVTYDDADEFLEKIKKADKEQDR